MALSLNPVNNLQSLRRASGLVNSLSPRQRWVLAGAAVALVAGLAWFARSMSAPDYTSLYTGLDAADAQQVSTALGALGIPYTASPDGTGISVPASALDRARLALASEGLPHSGQLGFEVFDKTNWSGSDFDEQVNYQRALEGELERTIETIHGVASARVHITIAHDSLFTAEDRRAKAAVLLTLRPGANGQLDPGMVAAIQHLVASSVDKLGPNDVSVMDASGNLALSGQAQSQTTLESSLAAKIVATLAPVVGAAHVRASVNVAYDPTSTDETQETYDPKGAVVTSSQRSSAGAPAAAAAAGVPGTTSNLPAVQAPGTDFKAQIGLSSAGAQQSDNETYAVSRSVNHTVRPADTIARLTAAVVVDNAVSQVASKGHTRTVSQPRTPQEMQQLQSLAAAAIGLNPSRGDVLTVTNLPFVAPALPAAPAPAPAAPAVPPWRLYLQYGALALCGLLLCAWFAFKTLRSRPAAAPAAAAPLPAAAPAPQLGASDAVSVQPANFAASENIADVLNITQMLGADPDATPPEVRQVLQLKTRVAERVKREPAIASRLVQGWMRHREDM